MPKRKNWMGQFFLTITDGLFRLKDILSSTSGYHLCLHCTLTNSILPNSRNMHASWFMGSSWYRQWWRCPLIFGWFIVHLHYRKLSIRLFGKETAEPRLFNKHITTSHLVRNKRRECSLHATLKQKKICTIGAQSEYEELWW